MVDSGVWDIGARLGLCLALCCTLTPSPTHAYIYAHYVNMSASLFEDLPALFGSELPQQGLRGVLVASRPMNACSAIEPAPLPPQGNANLTKFIVLIKRYECNFDIKVLHAQQAGYSAVIIHNMYSDVLLNMNASNETIAEEIDIPAVFTSYYASQVLRKHIIPDEGAYVILKLEVAFPLVYYLIPFTGVVGLIMLVMGLVMVVRCVQYRKRLRRNRLSKEQLKRLPIHKFRKGDDYDVCAICLDDYEDGDKLRVLPCSHAYHSKCVDPWLTQSKKTCPVCKQRVTRPHPDHPESESEEEEEEEEVVVTARRRDPEGGGGAEGDTERTPLLRPSNPGSPSGSLASSYCATVTVTTAQCLAPSPRCDSPLLGGYHGYYSPEESSDSEGEGAGEVAQPTEDDTARLLGTGGLNV
ncbi:E3 ubiquitin-protein ligase RNF167 [Gadus morhua]|uniref:RING-type E3 ubiquitin transferase n=1 Tax=Gadus morhua TaxID=8049 RepID=A0A8C4ZM52_GADMO|nr:E3 ubiquitin-protein ligase RNF167-like [Gadus morhua]